MAYREIAARKQHERASRIPAAWRLEPIPDSTLDVTAIPRTCGIMTPHEVALTEDYDAVALTDGLRNRVWTAVEVTTAFCKRAAIAQQVVNCLTEIFFDEAIERAQYLDEYMRQHGKPIGPLHGLPISIKDSFDIENRTSSVGLVSLADTPANTTAVLPQLLLSAGAILYVKTTTPQGQLCYDTYSNLWGRTTNPHNRALSAGGSSGGEAALQGMHGSAISMGTDMAGSIRYPAACCGVYGFKPSSGSVPRLGTGAGMNPGADAVGIPIVAGPLARSVRDIKFFFETLHELQPWRHDPGVTPFSVAPTLTKRPLRIGVLSENVTRPLPPIASVLEETAEKLRQAGHAIYRLDIPELPEVFKLCHGYILLDGNEHIFDMLESVGEPLAPWLAQRMDKRGPKPLHDLYALNVQRSDIEAKMLRRVWGSTDGLDVVLAPVMPHPVPKHDKFESDSWTVVWSLLDWPAGVIPVQRFEMKHAEGELPQDPPLNLWDERNRRLWAAEKRKEYVGSPMAIQLIGRKSEDAGLWAAMEIIDHDLNCERRAAEAAAKL